MKLSVSVALAAVVMSACGPSAKRQNADSEENNASAVAAEFVLPQFPTSSADTAQMRAVLAAHMPPAAQFNPVAGDAQFIDSVYAKIIPNRGAQSGNLQHGKMLARIDADRAFGNYGHGSNYWIAAQLDGDTTWKAVFIPDSATVKIVAMRTIDNGGAPNAAQSMARWVVGSSAVALEAGGSTWATCAGGICCCTGNGCDDFANSEMHGQAKAAKKEQ